MANTWARVKTWVEVKIVSEMGGLVEVVAILFPACAKEITMITQKFITSCDYQSPSPSFQP